MSAALIIFGALAIAIEASVIGFLCGWNERGQHMDWRQYELPPKPKNLL